MSDDICASSGGAKTLSPDRSCRNHTKNRYGESLDADGTRRGRPVRQVTARGNDLLGVSTVSQTTPSPAAIMFSMSENDAASKWGIKEYVFGLAGLVLILFVAGLVKWENGSVALTDRSEVLIEALTADDLPEGWVKVSGTGYTYGGPGDWYYAEPEDKFAVGDKRTADSSASDEKTDQESSALFTVLKVPPGEATDDGGPKEYAKVVGKTWNVKFTWSEIELSGKSAWSFEGKGKVSGVTILARQVLVPEEGILIDMKYQEGSDMKNTLQKILKTWTWEE